MVCGELRKAPIWDDVSTLRIRSPDDSIDILYGGFPCQDISVAGHGKGLEGERSGLFFEILRLAKEIKPKFLFIENVPAITSRGGLQVIREITEIGYDCRWDVISAEEFVDQNRERWFCLAKLNSQRFEQRASETVQSIRRTGVNEESSNHKLSTMECWGSFARSMRKDHGIPHRVDRVRALGNAVVPAQAKKAFKMLMGLD
jgi:DNA (cytosine-5)-methyltransferase 1